MTIINYGDIEYGAYLVSDDPNFNEAMRFDRALFNRLYTQKVRLPEGKGNVVYVLSDTFENTLNFVDGSTFLIPPTYRKLYYPVYKIGTFFGRRYKILLVKEKANRDKLIETRTNLTGYPNRTINSKLQESIFINTSDFYQAIEPIVGKFPIQKTFKEFFPEFFSTVTSWSPEKIKSTRPIDNNRIILIDSNGFNFNPSAKLAENKTNPLFLFYLIFLRTGDLSITKIDMDIMVISDNKFIKFNPAKITSKDYSRFKGAIFRMAKADFDKYTDSLSKDEQHMISVNIDQNPSTKAIQDKVDSYTQYNSPAIKSMVQGMVTDKVQTNAKITSAVIKDNPGVNIEVSPSKTTTVTNSSLGKTASDFKKYNSIVGDLDPLFTNTKDEVEDDTEDDEGEISDSVAHEAEYILDNDTNLAEEVEDEIQKKIAPLDSEKNSPINSARDEKLRKQQKAVIVNDETIEEILSRENSNIPIKSDDKSKVIHTTNPNMKSPTFVNFDKTYIDELYVKHIVASLDCLKDKNNPFYIVSITRVDSSTAMDYKETWTVKLRDETNKMHTLKFNMPKFYQDKFLWLGGNKKMILKQNLYNPVVKDTPNVVIITTNYNKVTIERKSSSSFSMTNKLLSFIKKSESKDLFVFGDSSNTNVGNRKYINTLEYDDLSRTIYEYKSGGCELYFNRDYLMEHYSDNTYDKRGNEFLIGFENKIPVLINEDTGRDRLGRTIVEIIYNNLSGADKLIFDRIKESRNTVFAEGKLLGKFIPIIIILTIWNGIRKSLDDVGVNWEFHAGKLPDKSDFNKGIIKFQDGYLEFEKNLYSELILNGLYKLKPETITFDSLDDHSGYVEYIHSIFGTYSILTQFKTFNEFFIDPITKEVCRGLQYPSTSSGLIIYATKLLADNAYLNKASDKSYRLRSVEIIPAILYDELAIAYKRYVDSGGRIPFSISPDAVIKKLLAVNTVEDYSTLNPAIEVGKMYTVSAKGFRGSNEDRSYDEEKRSYDESSIGKLAMSTSNDANVGINRELVIEPTITGALGFREPVDDLDQLTDVNVFSPVEMLTPGSVRIDDPVRTAMANKQTKHLVPVAESDPSLVSNGFDEMIQFYLSNDFVVNAKEDGEVVEVSNATGFIMVQYKSGEFQAISIDPEVVKNSGGGFYLTQQLTCPLRMGEKFKKDEVLAYHPQYFSYSKINGLRFNMGPRVKVAFLSTYNTYEDAGIATESLSEKMRTAITHKEIGTFNKNNNILKIVNVGDTINIGDILVKYDESFEDKDINAFISKLSDDSKDDFQESIKSDVVSDCAGIIRSIKVYSQHPPEALSDSLGAVVRKYFNHGISRKDFLSKYDKTESIVKAGYLLTDTTEPIVSRYNEIKKIKNIDVLIEFYIESESALKTGDKVAIYSANKNIVSEMIPKGYEPFSEFRPEEEISILNNPGTIARRMTSSVMPIAAANKIMIELKRYIKSNVKYAAKVISNRKDLESMIYKVYSALDPSGVNTTKYKTIFGTMNDKAFTTYMNTLLNHDHENFMLDIVELEHDLNMDKCELAAKVLKVPLFEYVFLPHLSMDKNNIPATKQKCLVGYLNLKRTQQMIEHKNGLAISNANRSAITNQAVNNDKNARDSDTEAALLASLGAYNILQELHGPRADDMVMKNEMDMHIVNKGYVELGELTNVTTNKSTLNAVNTYMIGMQLHTDLVSPTYLANSIIKKVR